MSSPLASPLSLVTKSSVEDDEHEKAYLALILGRYKDHITTFPKEKGWMSKHLHMYQGFWHTSKNKYSIETVMALQETYQAHPSDIYLASLPKSGTTWMMALIFAIVNRTRNPKDVLVSLFHFANKVRDKSLGQMTFKEAFEMFRKGVMPYGPHWDHVKGYHSASLKHSKKILFLTYENMKMDIINNVKRLAKFLGYPFTKEEEAEGALEEIVRICSFEVLREVNKQGNLPGGIPNQSVFREGKVGDWRNHLTTEMNQIMDQVIKEKFQDLDISF